MLPPSPALVLAPVGAAAESVRAWFNAAVEAVEPVVDGTLTSERGAADIYRPGKSGKHPPRLPGGGPGLVQLVRPAPPPTLPASGQDVAAFLAGERRRKLLPEALELRRAAIRYLHRPAGCPVPTDDVCASETMAGICREAAQKGVVPRKMVAAAATILPRLLAPIAGDIKGRRDRAILLVGFAGALRRSEPAEIRFEHLKKADRGIGSLCRKPGVNRPTR